MIDQVHGRVPRQILEILLYEAPPFAVALVTAEVFFKFGSFTLEVIVFLALWRGLDWIYKKLIGSRD